ncbi:hypothetical protein Btru_044998 [Bulinus truncatus]|nr:hypothetical protein Btru_044998 [Bulinus truncatus]
MQTDLDKASSRSSIRIHSKASSVARSLGSLPAITDLQGTIIDPTTSELKRLTRPSNITSSQVDNQIKCAVMASFCFVPIGYIALVQARKARQALHSGNSIAAEYYVQSAAELTALSICIGLGILVLALFLLSWHLKRTDDDVTKVLADFDSP